MSSSKRARTSTSSEGAATTSEAADDPVFGLDVCGKVFYCHKSTLVNSSPYFAGRFKGDFSASVAYEDPQGRQVFFVERPPSTFPIIFEFMVSGGCLELPSFQENPTLVRNLRREAEYFGMDSLIEALKTTKAISPVSGDQGILYWLGSKKGTSAYRNPHLSGAIHVGGWIDDKAYENVPRIHYCSTPSARAYFVQHRAPFGTTILPNGSINLIVPECRILWCSSGWDRMPVVLDMKSVCVRPSHYSLRAIRCLGMSGDWNFEGSNDGIHWDVLHAARDDKSLRLRGPSESNTLVEALKKTEILSSNMTENSRSEALIDFVEHNFRHTWELTPPPTQFYRFFRIIGAGDIFDEDDDGLYRSPCLHGEGMELFGDVYEE